MPLVQSRAACVCIPGHAVVRIEHTVLRYGIDRPVTKLGIGAAARDDSTVFEPSSAMAFKWLLHLHFNSVGHE
jgi:hypothetical protein